MKESKIGILDLIPRDKESSAIEAFDNSIQCLQRADKVGLSRYWYAEHHATASILSSSPLVMAGVALAKTERITVGSGGVMLDNFNPYQIAEAFKVLEALAPGRVEAGIGHSNDKEKALQKDFKQAFTDDGVSYKD